MHVGYFEIRALLCFDVLSSQRYLSVDRIASKECFMLYVWHELARAGTVRDVMLVKNSAQDKTSVVPPEPTSLCFTIQVDSTAAGFK